MAANALLAGVFGLIGEPGGKEVHVCQFIVRS
jgi:hypothetical protein